MHSEGLGVFDRKRKVQILSPKVKKIFSLINFELNG